MGEYRQKILIGLLGLTLIPAVIFLGIAIGRLANTGKAEKPQVQVTETAAVSAVPEETVPVLPESTEPVQSLPAETEETIPEETEATHPEETEATLPEETVSGPTEPVSFDTVPEYFQADYAHIRFGQTNMAYGGSGVVSLAMVASYLTKQAYMPDEMMEFFDHHIGSSMEWLEYASTELQLPWSKAANVHKALEAVHDGKIVIALMNASSRFSDGYHYIVWTGINEEGRVVVHDPNKANYEKWGLTEGFQNGFADKELNIGFSGGWIYDPEAMPEEPFIYTLPDPGEFRYPGVELTEWETYLLAQLIYMEAQGEPYEGQQAVAEVVLNRLVSEKFPNNIHDIIYAAGQFPSAENLNLAKPTHVQYEAIERALNGPYILPIDVVFYATFRVNDNVWGDIGNHTFCYAYQ